MKRVEQNWRKKLKKIEQNWRKKMKRVIRYGSVEYSTVRLIIPLLYFSYMNIFDFLFSQSFAIDISNGMRT